MSYIDIILLLFLLYGAYKGFREGFIIEVATLLGLFLGVYVSIKYSSYTEDILTVFFNLSTKYISYIALAITFIVVIVAVYVLGKILTKFVDILSLGLINKMLGTVLGVVKYFVIVGVLLLIVDALNSKFQFLSEETLSNSQLYTPFLSLAKEIYNYIQS